MAYTKLLGRLVYLGIFVAGIIGCAKAATPIAPTATTIPPSQTPTEESAAEPNLTPELGVSPYIPATPTLSIGNLPECSERLLAFAVSFDPTIKDQQSGIYAACPSTRSIEFVTAVQHGYRLNTMEMSLNGNAILFGATFGFVEHSYIGLLNLDDLSTEVLLDAASSKLVADTHWVPQSNYISYINSANVNTIGETIEFLDIESGMISEVIREPSIDQSVISPTGRQIIYRGGEPLPNQPLPTYMADLSCEGSICTTSNPHRIDNVEGEASWRHSSLIVSIWGNEQHPKRIIRFTDPEGNIVREIIVDELDPDIGRINWPVLSPDGAKLAFVSDDVGMVSNIFILDLATMSLSNLTQNTQEGISYAIPTW